MGPRQPLAGPKPAPRPAGCEHEGGNGQTLSWGLSSSQKLSGCEAGAQVVRTE